MELTHGGGLVYLPEAKHWLEGHCHGSGGQKQQSREDKGGRHGGGGWQAAAGGHTGPRPTEAASQLERSPATYTASNLPVNDSLNTHCHYGCGKWLLLVRVWCRAWMKECGGKARSASAV